jgi:hypothetical protein
MSRPPSQEIRLPEKAGGHVRDLMHKLELDETHHD